MQALSNNYLIDLANQLAFLSAFLGGIAAAFLATLLVADVTKRMTNWLVGTTALSTCCFIIAVISFVMLGTIVHPDSPGSSTEEVINTARVVSFLSFALGITMLLASVGLSGWLRSKRVGQITSAVALLAFIIVYWAIKGFK